MCSSFVAAVGNSTQHKRRSQHAPTARVRGQKRSEEGGAAESGRQLSGLKEDVRQWQDRQRVAAEEAEAAEAEVRSLQQQTEHLREQLRLINSQLSHQQAMQQKQLEAAEITARALSMAEDVALRNHAGGGEEEARRRRQRGGGGEEEERRRRQRGGGGEEEGSSGRAGGSKLRGTLKELQMKEGKAVKRIKALAVEERQLAAQVTRHPPACLTAQQRLYPGRGHHTASPPQRLVGEVTSH
jgi:hypothetical protein